MTDRHLCGRPWHERRDVFVRHLGRVTPPAWSAVRVDGNASDAP